MRFSLTVAALVGSALAQRPANVSMCDYYTTALLMNNTAANQYTLLTLLVNTAVIGNYTKPNVGIAVQGILTPGMFNGTMVNLLPYFDGGLASTNNGGDSGVAQNFLDDGGATPLLMNKPANGTSSSQYTLLTHLYEYFGVLLGCSTVGSSGFPAYGGSSSQYQVHKYMALDQYQVGYFITQVGLAAASFGVTTEDVTAVGMALAGIFDVKCGPPTTVVPSQGAQLQSICIESTCAQAMNASCGSYAAVQQPVIANATLADGEGVNGTAPVSTVTAAATGTATGSATGTMATTSTTAASGANMLVGSSFAAVALALFAYAL